MHRLRGRPRAKVDDHSGRMKLLFDENLSYQLARQLADLFPDSVHVRDIGLKAADDPAVWEFAKNNGLMIVSKDSDMHQRSYGASAENHLGASRQLLDLGRRRVTAQEFFRRRGILRGRLRVIPNPIKGPDLRHPPAATGHNPVKV